MGKSCIRFKKLEDLPLDVIGEAIRRMPVKKYLPWIQQVFANNAAKRGGKTATTKAKSKPAAKQKTAAHRKPVRAQG